MKCDLIITLDVTFYGGMVEAFGRGIDFLLLFAPLGNPQVLDIFEREMCPWAISKYFGDLVSNTSA